MENIGENILLIISSFLYNEQKKNFKYVSRRYRNIILYQWEKNIHKHTVYDIIKFYDMQSLIAGSYNWGFVYSDITENCKGIISDIAMENKPRINVFRYVVRKFMSEFIINAKKYVKMHDVIYETIYSKDMISANNKIQLSKIIIEEFARNFGTINSIEPFINLIYMPEHYGYKHQNYKEFKYCNFDICSHLLKYLYDHRLDGLAHNILVNLFRKMCILQPNEFILQKLNKLLFMNKKILCQYSDMFILPKIDLEERILLAIDKDLKHIFMFLCKCYIEELIEQSKINNDMHDIDNQIDLHLYFMKENYSLYEKILNYYQYISNCYDKFPVIFGKFLVKLIEFWET